MKANSDKSHLLMSCKGTVNANIDESLIKSNKAETLLGIKIDSELKFEDHVNFLCKKASQKLSALARIAPYMDIAKRKCIFKAFICSQFNY